MHSSPWQATGYLAKIFMNKNKLKQFCFSIISILIGIFISLAITESALRIFDKSSKKYYVWPPFFKKIFKIRPEIFPGVYNDSIFLTNSEGMRGDDIPQQNVDKILAVGGSTTECLYLDQKEAWPSLLQGLLNGNSQIHIYWVGNVGRSARTSRENYLQIKYLLEQYPDIKTVLLLVGVNDFLQRLKQDTTYKTKDIMKLDDNDLHNSFEIVPKLSSNRDLKLHRILRNIYDSYKYKELTQDTSGEIYIKWRRNRQLASTIINHLPDLSYSLTEYKNNLNHIINITEKYGVRLIFITQPSMWSNNLNQNEKYLLWMGGIGNFKELSDSKYYSADALAKGMNMYNKALIDVCKSRNLEYIELDRMIPKNVSAFYDDVHFNENGAKLAANAIFVYLRNK
jgi:lysophospholipase L1-like esterase